jgi:hypothetical protein
MDKEHVKTTVYKAGYQVKEELWTYNPNEEPTKMKSAYTPSGDYIGNPESARYFVVKRGIIPELRTPDSNVCSIGYCPKERKWYGWSHRAIYGFGIGTKITDKSTIASKWAGKTIGSLEEAKLAASDFAESVS